MKYLKVIVLILCALTVFSGCALGPQSQQQTANFYYLCKEPVYGTEDGYIRAEPRETEGMLSEQEILSIYLTGPISEDLVSPFPEGSTILQYENNGSIIDVTVSPHFRELKGIQLVAAGGCLAKTAMALTDCDTVILSVKGGFENMSGPLTFHKNNMIFSDLENYP